MKNNQSFSSSQVKFIGILCTAGSLLLIILADLSNDSIWLVGSLIAGVPLIVLGLSLLFGEGKKGKGVLSPMTLVLCGVFVIVTIIILKFSGDYISPFIFFVPFAILTLAFARKRK